MRTGLAESCALLPFDLAAIGTSFCFPEAAGGDEDTAAEAGAGDAVNAVLPPCFNADEGGEEETSSFSEAGAGVSVGAVGVPPVPARLSLRRSAADSFAFFFAMAAPPTLAAGEMPALTRNKQVSIINHRNTGMKSSNAYM